MEPMEPPLDPPLQRFFVLPNKSCVHLAPILLLMAEVLLEYFCSNLVSSWIGMFAVILLLLPVLSFDLWRKLSGF